MRIGVGSGNPVKRRAVEAVVEGAADPVAGATVEARAVDSGVSEQPRGREETVAGAEHRARAVRRAGEYDLGVGIEGGVATVEGVPGLYLIMWAAVTDGERTGRAAGPSVRLPEAVAARVRAGDELGPVMDDLLDEDGVARRGGAAGALTAGGLDRERALRTSVAGALGPFATDRYD